MAWFSSFFVNGSLSLTFIPFFMFLVIFFLQEGLWIFVLWSEKISTTSFGLVIFFLFSSRIFAFILKFLVGSIVLNNVTILHQVSFFVLILCLTAVLQSNFFAWILTMFSICQLYYIFSLIFFLWHSIFTSWRIFWASLVNLKINHYTPWEQGIRISKYKG